MVADENSKSNSSKSSDESVTEKNAPKWGYDLYITFSRVMSDFFVINFLMMQFDF